MLSALLPASTVAAGRRASAIVRGITFRPWLMIALKQSGKPIRYVVNVSRQVQLLKGIISDKDAIWTLCWLSLPKSPEADLWRGGDSALAIHCWHMINIEAYIIYVDLELDQMHFKLTPETVEALVDYHREVFLVDTAKTTEDWPGKEAQLIKLDKDFGRAASHYAYRTKASVLEGLDDGGTGELLVHDSRRVQKSIINLFVPLWPPPPPPPPPLPPPPQPSLKGRTQNLRHLVPQLAHWTSELDAMNTALCPPSMMPDTLDTWCQQLIAGPAPFEAVNLPNSTVIPTWG